MAACVSANDEQSENLSPDEAPMFSVYLVRHAEKEADKANPGLTPKGIQRARWLATYLSGEKIKHIFSTQYQRTLQTAQPLADLLKTDIALYNPTQLKEFCSAIKQLKANALVVGHSNTTPFLVQCLSGKYIQPITEKEYNRLFKVDIHSTSTELVEVKMGEY